MRKRLQIALMASTVAATSLSLTSQLRAERRWRRKLLLRKDHRHRRARPQDLCQRSCPGESSPSCAGSTETPRRTLMYWSSKENRWKPVPPAECRGDAGCAVGSGRGQRISRTRLEPVGDCQDCSANFRGPIGNPGDIDSAIEQAAARHNVDPNLVRAVVKVESNFNPNAVSRKGAMGLMQLMPSTARQLKVKNPFDPEQNVDAGVRHLKQLLESYGGDIKLTLAAYNAGAGAVARSSGVPHYAETQNYVRRITNLYYGGVRF